MRLWRLSTDRYADAMDGGYGLLFDGRWNTVGRPVTYCATSPSLCMLEKLVHVEDPELLPALTMVLYEAPDMEAAEYRLADLPEDWRARESWTQQQGDCWHERGEAALLRVPSAIVPIADSPDWNVLINPAHPAASAIRIVAKTPFRLDPRLL